MMGIRLGRQNEISLNFLWKCVIECVLCDWTTTPTCLIPLIPSLSFSSEIPKMSDQDLNEDFGLSTVGYNPRFPNQSQTKHCWSAFVEKTKCNQIKGEDD